MTGRVSFCFALSDPTMLTARPDKVGPHALTFGLTVFLKTRLDAMATVWWIVKAGRAIDATAWKLHHRVFFAWAIGQPLTIHSRRFSEE